MGFRLRWRDHAGAEHAGDLLYATLAKYGFSEGTFRADPKDGLKLLDARIANAVRCLPPANKPTTAEIRQCNGHLKAELAAMEKMMQGQRRKRDTAEAPAAKPAGAATPAAGK